MSREPLLVSRDLHRRFGARRVLRGFDLEIAPGRVVALLGRNGAGKTTFLRHVVGLLRANSGTLRVFGQDPWTATPAERARIGFLPEEGFPFPQLGLAAAVSLIAGLEPRFDGALLQSLVERFVLPTDVPYESLSRGQKRKFECALVLSTRPRLVLLDDPAQGLDVGVRRELLRALQPLLEEDDASVLFSSHVFSDVERIADEVVIVHEGRVLLHECLDVLKEQACEVRGPAEVLDRMDPARWLTRSGSTRVGLLPDPALAASAGVEITPLALEDLFLAATEADSPEAAK